MSDRYNILGQHDISSAGVTNIYTVPITSSTNFGTIEVSPLSVSLDTQTLLTSIVFSFVGTGASVTGDLRLTLGVEGSVPVNLMSEITFYDKQNSILDIRMPLAPSSVLDFNIPAPSYTSGNLYITAFGIELVTGYGPS